MFLPAGFTDGLGIPEKIKHHIIGNAFHAGVFDHLIACWERHVKVTRKFDSTRGFPGEGPTSQQMARLYARRSVSGTSQGGSQSQGAAAVGSVEGPGPPVAGAAVVALPKAIAKRRRTCRGSAKAAWRKQLPRQQVQMPRCETVLEAVGGLANWGRTDLAVLPGNRKDVLGIPAGDSFTGFAAAVKRDFIVLARAAETWKAYRAWVNCFMAWCDCFAVDKRPLEDNQSAWVDCLIVSVAILGLCYSASTLDVYTAAVSSLMKDAGMVSPFRSQVFRMVSERIKRRQGLGRQKKPCMTAEHVAGFAVMPKPVDMTLHQFSQGKAITAAGWRNFNMPQDFNEFQPCDWRVQPDGGLDVTVRRAKNDKHGRTRTAYLSRAKGEEGCPVRLWERYCGMCDIKVALGCDKVPGCPDRCTKCGPAFPSILRNKGKMDYPMPSQRVTGVVKEMYQGLAAFWKKEPTWAAQFSGKSMRCGGVSAAAENGIRDGVVQGHGGWFQRESLRHYDLMQESERNCVSDVLNSRLDAIMQSWRGGTV